MDRVERLRALPKVDVLAESPELASFPAAVRTRAARIAVDRLRGQAEDGLVPTFEKAVSLACQEADLAMMPPLRHLINMTGVVCHTGLGRARLAQAASEAVLAASQEYVDLEFDLETGKRGDRQEHVRSLFVELTGAEDAFVVNNAAGAVLLALSALASGREVVLSRGQMVEIGGSFRLPDIVRQSGCQLVEVGCTNRTRLSDYEEAVGPETAVILRCHPSNFAIVGFTEEVPVGDLSALAEKWGATLIDDQGSGLILDTTRYGMPRQPTVQDSLSAGADVVVCSGDKLLGGPQAGIILGSKSALSAIRNHPLARTLRIDKLCLTALAATLRLYRDGREIEIPTWRYLGRSLEQVRRDAERLIEAWPGEGTVREAITEAGSGSAPGTGVPSFCAALESPSADGLVARLRDQKKPIIGRIVDGKVWLDPRTVEEDELEYVCRILKEWPG